MRSIPFLPELLVAFLGVGAAQAEPLTCDVFRDRLNGALLSSGQEMDAIAFKPGFSSVARGTRFDWSTPDLNGTLSCGPADQFEEFGVELHFKDRNEVARALLKFKTLQGASLCALTAGSMPVCIEFGRAMMQQALEQMGQAFNHGAREPAGLSARDVAAVHVELTSAPTLITYLVGPGRGSTIDAARQPLPAAGGTPPG